MKLTIDTAAATLSVDDGGAPTELPLYSKRAFELLSREWIKLGWNQKYTYTFSWMGRPIIQFPPDLIRVQEVLFSVRPDVVIETGIAHGGSLIFYATLFKAMGRGRVIGVDIDIRKHNRAALEAHPLFEYLTLIEGSSIDPALVQQVASRVRPGETVLVLLDSCHTREHVLAELEAYAPLVTQGSYIVATDGLMQDLAEVPRGERTWGEDNPAAAARLFASRHPEFVLEPPRWPFNESDLSEEVTHWPDAWLRKL